MGQKRPVKTGYEKNKFVSSVPLVGTWKSKMAEENGVEDLNGKTEELALENGECDEDEKGILFKKP